MTEREMTAFAERAMRSAMSMADSSKERSELVATSVGAQAARNQWDKQQLRKWFQVGYGTVFVKMQNLIPGADLKDLVKVAEKSFDVASRKFGKEGSRQPAIQKTASQAAWALISNSVTEARLEAHRLHHMVARAKAIVDASENKEHVYRAGGDIIEGVPDRLQRLEKQLDKASYALVQLGRKSLRNTLSIEDRQQVDDTVLSAKPFDHQNSGKGAKKEHSSQSRVARAFLNRSG